jgi:hypothetical protein
MALTDEQNLYNHALDLIGEYQVTESDTSSKQAEACARNYATSRDEVLRSHLWNEAIARSCVLQSTTAPIHGYSYKYLIPSDCLRILSIGSDLYEWRSEGGYILTDYIIMPDEWATATAYVAGQYVQVSDVTYVCVTSHTSSVWATEGAYWTTQTGDYGYINLEYIKQLTTITSFSPQLYKAIYYNLAIKIAAHLTGDMKNKAVLIKEYEELVMPQARSVDSMQGTPRTIYNSYWKRSRG